MVLYTEAVNGNEIITDVRNEDLRYVTGENGSSGGNR